MIIFAIDLPSIIKSLEGRTPIHILNWAIRKYHPRIAIASSFSVEDTFVIDIATKIQPNIKVFYINTGYQFKETDIIKDVIRKKYDLNLVEYFPKLGIAEQSLKYGEKLYEKKADMCCRLRKVEPIKRALSELDAWITGLRRSQAVTRKKIDVVQLSELGNQTLVKVNPLVNLTRRQVWKYTMDNKIPYNTLYDRGYLSIGCEPCTRPVQQGEHERAGRWAGKGKIECGIHNFTKMRKTK
ncbi:phosphoadenylyl-sulfate reductase [Candidatus Bathyarchaeota archaeon]|nr:phosphoadenylyl-sulfate reductase [Candidatus Bathyarchaeota archaeon]